MNPIKNLNTTKVFRTNRVFPQAALAGNLVFVSGITGVDPNTGNLISDSFDEQARQAFENIKTILEEAGSDLSNIAKTTIYMVHGSDVDFKMINKIYSDFFPVNPPARSAPQVMPFPGGILISVECIAQLPVNQSTI